MDRRGYFVRSGALAIVVSALGWPVTPAAAEPFPGLPQILAPQPSSPPEEPPAPPAQPPPSSAPAPQQAGTLTISALCRETVAGTSAPIRARLSRQDGRVGGVTVRLQKLGYPFTGTWVDEDIAVTDADGRAGFRPRPRFHVRYRVVSDSGERSRTVTVYPYASSKLTFEYGSQRTRVILRFVTPRVYDTSRRTDRVRANDQWVWFYGMTRTSPKRYVRVGRARVRGRAVIGSRVTWDASVSVLSRRIYPGQRYMGCWRTPPVEGTGRPIKSRCGRRVLPPTGS